MFLGCAIPEQSVPVGIYPTEQPKVPTSSATAAIVPEGYKVEIFMKDLNWPTSIEFDERATRELGLYAGRIIGYSLFIILYHTAGQVWALRYALLIIAAVYFVSLAVARSIVNDPAWNEPVKDVQEPVNEFKEPIEL